MNKIDYSKITIPDGEKYSFTTPSSDIIFCDNSTGEQREVMRITKDGITSNPDVPTDEGAKAIIRALDGYIKNLTQRTWVGLTDEEMMDAIYVDDTPMERGRRVESKLRSKNTRGQE